MIFHLALGGCLKAPPVTYGITADTGGHIAYVLDAARAQAERADVDHVRIVTRLFDNAALGAEHYDAETRISDKLSIARIATADRRYLEKEALAADLPAFTEAFCAYLATLPRRPDVIHTHFADAAAIAAEARRRLGIPFVYTPHALGIDKREAGTPSPALDARIASERDAIAGADAIILSSREEAERQVGAYGVADAEGRSFCVPPGVPHAFADDVSPTLADRLSEWLTDPAKPVLLAIARPVRKKNIAALVRAFAGSPALQAAANLVVLAGQQDGFSSREEQAVVAELRMLATSTELRGRVALPPRHDAADVRALYALAARGGLFVNPALHEPFGLTLLEAAQAGVPVVATRAGGPQEIIDRIGHGVLVDPTDETAIAAACLRIVTDRGLRDGLVDAARRRIGLYDWGRYAAETTGHYAALMPAPGLLACDIDGTLTGCENGAREFADWAARRRIPYVVATGRAFGEARAIVARWRLPEPDAYLVDVGSTMMLRDSAGGWRRCDDHADRLDRGWNRPAIAKAVRSLAIEPQAPACQSAHKLSYFGRADEAGAIGAALSTAGLQARVIHSHGRLIDILPPTGGKAAAIAGYARRSGLSLAACVAAGDSGNDADMLDACGRAIIVANADRDLAHVAPRRGLYRATRAHAGGVMEGLGTFGLAPGTVQVAA